jgi:type VI secretion system protein VasD
MAARGSRPGIRQIQPEQAMIHFHRHLLPTSLSTFLPACMAPTLSLMLSLMLMLTFAGCASAPPKPTTAEIRIAVADNVNPDAGGRPSPLVLHLYELTSMAAFQGADLFSLLERDKETLGSELRAKEELILQPGKVVRIDRQLHADTRHVAVVAAFRGWETAVWRAAIPIRINQANPVAIEVSANQIEMHQK